jgi:hypothetical protein
MSHKRLVMRKRGLL